MDGLRELSEDTFSVLIKNYILGLVLLGLILAFALYVYFFRHTIAEYFDDGKQKKEVKTEAVLKKETPA